MIRHRFSRILLEKIQTALYGTTVMPTRFRGQIKWTRKCRGSGNLFKLCDWTTGHGPMNSICFVKREIPRKYSTLIMIQSSDAEMTAWHSLKNECLCHTGESDRFSMNLSILEDNFPLDNYPSLFLFRLFNVRSHKSGWKIQKHLEHDHTQCWVLCQLVSLANQKGELERGCLWFGNGRSTLR